GMSWMIFQHRSSTIDVESQRRNVNRGLAVPGLDPWQPVPPGRLAPKAAHRDVGGRCPQPGPALLFCQTPQDLPLPGCPLTNRLYQVIGERSVPAGQHAGVPEQPASMGGEARGELARIAPPDLLLTH